MGQLYYAQTQLYSIVLGVKFSGQYELNIAIHYSLLGAHLFFCVCSLLNKPTVPKNGTFCVSCLFHGLVRPFSPALANTLPSFNVAVWRLLLHADTSHCSAGSRTRRHTHD